MVGRSREENSPTVPAMTVSWPQSLLTSPASCTTGTEDAQRARGKRECDRRRSADPDTGERAPQRPARRLRARLRTPR